MKWTSLIIIVVISVLAAKAKAEAKIEAMPLQAEQNFRLLRKTMEMSNGKRVTADDEVEGSGDLEDDYEDEDYYDDDYYDNYDEELGSGFGKDMEANLVVEKSSPSHAEVVPDEKEDFHFDEDKEDDLLYEYKNDLAYGDDDYLDYLYEVEKDLPDEKTVITVTKVTEVDSEVENLPSWSFFEQPSYIFLMLSSALISFAIFILAFILCRRYSQKRQKKAMPFIVSSQEFTLASTTGKSTPIVKNYQRVPTTTKELISAEMGLTTTSKPKEEKPLLT